jgi:phospholipase C
MSLQHIDTFVIVMLENRSFDHMLGYLSLNDANPPMRVDGLRDDPAWQQQHGNDFGGKNDTIVPLDPKHAFVDPPHTSIAISQQIETPPHLPSLKKMGGFVASYANPNNYKPTDPRPGPTDLPLVMGYNKKPSVPVFDFFARNFAVCDKWFSALPTSTQPNRLMAMSGESKISDNVTLTQFPNQDLVYDWLNRTPDPASTTSTVPWCSYQWKGFPFFTLMSAWRGRILSQLNDSSNLNHFRHYSDFFGNGETFASQWKRGGDTIPSVVFIEPKYTDDVVSSAPPNDDHPPTGISSGQDFLRDIYNTLISNTELWSKTMMIVTYDEHGGFFDHVPPLNIPASAGDQFFRYTGARVPAFVVSPHVEPGTVFQGPLDHTSILQLLADRFRLDQTYSKAVTDRQKHLVRLSTILPPHPPATIRAPKIPKSVAADIKKAGKATLKASVKAAAKGVSKTSSNETAEAFRELTPLVATRYPRLLQM